ncbi:MAG: hypothetical protein ACTHJL_08065 [Amnibacterium sp.]
MSYIEMPVADYRRRLAAEAPPARTAADPANLAAVTDDEVLAARLRHPQAFRAIDADPRLPRAEVIARERLIAEALRVGYLPPT